MRIKYLTDFDRLETHIRENEPLPVDYTDPLQIVLIRTCWRIKGAPAKPACTYEYNVHSLRFNLCTSYRAFRFISLPSRALKFKRSFFSCILARVMSARRLAYLHIRDSEDKN